jgi:CRP/FNR family transcriptional regulator, cyclic AMP receptor protein
VRRRTAVARALDAVVLEAPVFAGIDGGYAAQLAGCARTAGWEQGGLLFREGDAADTFYVVRRGRVALELFIPNRGPLTVETIEAGEVVGWSWLFPPYRWHFDGRAVAPVRAIAVDGACLRGKCDDDPGLGYELMRRFSQVMLERLQATRLRLADVYGSPR